ncbi:DUF7313 family protein [Halobellus ordinarius]|uniref:DUF7313 family protein n=1 Tax=Halobellus ordinarius TaxID=3075120 RepID=UPI0028800B6C|nr:hypothetical protein [Halobellus sp. ZY16]
MQPLQFLVPLDALEAVGPILPFVVLAFAVANIVTRLLQHSRHRDQADDDDGTPSRWLPHTLTTLGLVFGSFLFMIVEPHGGMVMSVLALAVFVSDFFELESRRVEARSKSKELERPTAAIGASIFALLYAGYQSLFFVIEPLWSALV